MRIRWVVLTFAAVLLGAIAGAMLAPQPRVQFHAT